MSNQAITNEKPRKRRSKPPIVVTGGDKGGVGKSFVARIKAALLRSTGQIVVGFDGDARNAHLERYYGRAMAVARPHLRREHGWADLYAGWEGAPDDAVVLIDLPGNIGDTVERELVRIHRIAEALDRDLIHVWVCDEEEDSVTLLRRVQGLAHAANTLVVLNGRFGASPRDFELWNASDLRTELLAHGARETYVPALPIRPRTKIARARCPFDDVSAARLAVWERVDFDMWWERVAVAFKGFLEMMEARS